ncbi:MAG: TonB-dependent receptor [Chitinophagaceae bacterium]|nr:MAG: TonB-dependent receptor [Chitinophagaceae bacterium]
MRYYFNLLTISILLLSAHVGDAQQPTGAISGTIIDGSSKTIESATIRLLKASDSSLVKMGVAGKDGHFEFISVPFGRFLVAVSAVGHDPAFSDVAELTAANPAVALKTIELVPSAKAMTGVVVTSKKPFIEQKAGKMVLNVEASPTSAGMTALELLEKSPGVSVDNDGNISLKGKQGVMILIDGKPTYMSGADLTALLKSMQSSNLDQIEIMTNPPAKYDAAGNSGIINIKTKKGIVRGMNGTANVGYTQALYSRFNGGVNLNYRNNKLNLFGGYNAGTYEGYNILDLGRRIYGQDKVTLESTIDQISRPHYDGYYQSAKLGIDYNFSKKDVAGIVLNGNFNDHNDDPQSNSFIRDVNGSFLDNLRSSSRNSRNSNNITANFNYKHTFDSTGRELSVDLDYANYITRGKTLLNTQSFNEAGHEAGTLATLRGVLPSDINIYSAKLDYVHPLKKGWKLEAGLKSSYVETDNKVEYFRGEGGGWSLDNNRSNHFLYKENINAAYGILSGSIKKWELSAGLRVENTISDGLQMSNDSSFRRNYTNLFPNAGVAYNLNEKNQFNLSYSRRVSRPNYGDLNPFTFFLDSLTYQRGNPYLQPQFTNNFELSHTWNRILTTTLNYTTTNDVITEMIKQEGNQTFQTRDNFNQLHQFGIALMANIPLKKWWNANFYVNGFQNSFEGLYGGQQLDLSFKTLMANMTHSFTLGDGWSGEISGWWRSKGLEGLLVIKSMGAMNAGISKQLLKKKGTLKVGIRDIFYTQKFAGYARYSDVDLQLSGRRDSRQLNVSFNYRFGKSSIAGERRRKSGATDEQGRVGGGN